jgi:hypothetical protein
MSIKLIKAVGFAHNSKNYVIKVFQVGNNLIARAYLNGMPANCCSYSVKMDSIIMGSWVYYFGNVPPYVQLIKYAIADIRSGNGIRKDIIP